MFKKLRKFNGGGHLALSLVAISLMAAVGYGWLVDRPVSVAGDYYDTVYPAFGKLMYVGAYAGASANVQVAGEYLAPGQQFWAPFCQTSAQNGVFNCANGNPPSTELLTQYHLRTHLISAGASISHGYAWQAPDVSPQQCANGNGN